MIPLREIHAWVTHDWGPMVRDAIQELWADHPGFEISIQIKGAYRLHQRQEAGLE